MQVTLVNDDMSGNNVRVIDSNASGTMIFEGYMQPNSQQLLTCRENDSGYGNLVTYQDNNPGIHRNLLNNGDRISL